MSNILVGSQKKKKKALISIKETITLIAELLSHCDLWKNKKTGKINIT